MYLLVEHQILQGFAVYFEIVSEERFLLEFPMLLWTPNDFIIHNILISANL